MEDIEGALWQYMTRLGVRTLCNPMHQRPYDSRHMHWSVYQARALRALGLLLADGTPTVGGGKTF